MINRLIGGFVAVLIGVSLIGPVATQVMDAADTRNSTGAACSYPIDANDPGCAVYLSSAWGATVLRMVPGFYALGIMGVGVAITYGALKDAGVV